MKIKRIIVSGSREEINRVTGEHHPNLIEMVKRDDLIFTPEMLLRKLFKGTKEEYDAWLMTNKLHPSQVNYHDINQKFELLKKLKNYTMKLLEESKTNPMFSNELSNIIIIKWLDSFDTLEYHIYDLSDFNKIEFLKISDSFKKKFTTNSPFAFLTIDELNQQIKIVESHKVLLLLDKKLPMGNKRGTALGQNPEKLYQNFFTTIGYKGRGELTEGLNHHRTNFKNFNFNLNTEIRLLNDIIYETLHYNRKEIQIAFSFGSYLKKLYFESDIKGTKRTNEELEALAIVEGTKSSIEKSLHKERQGSIPVDKTSIEVKKRIEHPKNSKEENHLIKDFKPNEIELNEIESNQPLNHILNNFEKEILKKQQGYAELAKEKITEALTNREQYIKEFYTLLNKGIGVSDVLNKFSERYASNPYIKGIIETSISGELQLQALKDKGIENLKYDINILKSKLQKLQKDLDIKETEIASLNQSIESTIIAHTRQIQNIEININELIEQKESLIEENDKQSKLISELEKLIIQYEKTLQEKDKEVQKYKLIIKNKDQKVNQMSIKIEHLNQEKSNLLNTTTNQEELIQSLESSLLDSKRNTEIIESDKRLLSKKIENYKTEIKHYIRQIEQLKEENS